MGDCRLVPALATLLGSALLLAGCGSAPMLRPADVEKVLVEGFTTQVGGQFTADCPDEIPAAPGTATTCTVTDRADGTVVRVEVVPEDDAGAFQWRAVSVAAPSSAEASPT